MKGKKSKKGSILPKWLETKDLQQAFIAKNCGYLRAKKSHQWYAIEDEDVAARYVFDVFLPFMAAHGYVLKKVRVKEGNKYDYMYDGRYLPAFMQDFHDQKSVFKVLASQPESDIGMPWMDGHVFVVDFFLWNAMREQDYTLQKSTRKDVGTKDIWSTIASFG